MRTDLEKESFVRDDELLHRRTKPHRLPDIAPPVGGIEFGAGEDTAGDGGEKGHGRRGGMQIAEGVEEIFADGIHLPRVKSVVDR